MRYRRHGVPEADRNVSRVRVILVSHARELAKTLAANPLRKGAQDHQLSEKEEVG